MDTRKFKLSDQKKRSPQRRTVRSWLIEHPELNPYKFTWDRFYRKITNRFRMLPDFLIIGGAKSGTTSLFAHLVEHPNIIPGSMKEMSFFQYLSNNKTPFYRSHFPIKRKNLITCEATSTYFVHPLIPARVHKLLPLVKLIVVFSTLISFSLANFQTS